MITLKTYFLDFINQDLSDENKIFLKFIFVLLVLDYVFSKFRNYLMYNEKEINDENENKNLFNINTTSKKIFHKMIIKQNKVINFLKEKINENCDNIDIEKLLNENELNYDMMSKELYNDDSDYELESQSDEEVSNEDEEEVSNGDEEDEEDEEYEEDEEDEEDDEDDEDNEDNEDDEDDEDYVEDDEEFSKDLDKKKKKLIILNDNCKEEIFNMFEFGSKKQEQERNLRKLLRIINSHN